MSLVAVDSLPETGLAARAARGDTDAYEQLVRQYHASCLRFASRMLRDEADAQDAVQDTFMRAFLAISRFDPRQPFRPWLFRILVNRCRTLALQRTRRARRFAHDPLALAGAPAPESHHEPEDRAVRRAIDSLDAQMREAFLLKYVEEMDYHEMSAALGASVSALKMRVKRACDTLRPRLREVYGDE